jgi:F0F1-type ATP synthase assembly protein I
VTWPPDSSAPNRGQSLRFAAIGIEFFSTILGFIVIGYYLDEYFRTAPALGVGGLLIGMILGIYRLVIGLGHLDRKR